MATVGGAFFVDCSHTTLFQANYARGNENGGVKVVLNVWLAPTSFALAREYSTRPRREVIHNVRRDFPHECHVTKTLSLKVHVTEDRVAAYAQFELADDPPALDTGATLSIDYFEAQVRSRQEPLRNWIKGRADVPDTRETRVFHFNEGGSAGWHYPWKSGRGHAVRETKHCLRAYVVALDGLNTCRVLTVVASPRFTIESARRKAEPLGPDTVVAFSRLFTPESSVHAKAGQIHALYAFLRDITLPAVSFVQPQILKQLQEIIVRNQATPRATAKRKRTHSADDVVVALRGLWSAPPTEPADATAQVRLEIGVNMLYEVYRHLPFMQKLVFKGDGPGPWRQVGIGNTPELYNCWIENTAKALDALLAKANTTLAAFCARVDSVGPVPLDGFLAAITAVNPRGYIEPPSRPRVNSRFSRSWTLDPTRVDLRHVAPLPSLSLLSVLRGVSFLAGFSFCIQDATLFVRSYFEWLPTAWMGFVLDGAPHACDAVLPSGEPLTAVPLQHYIAWRHGDHLRVDLDGPNLLVSVRAALLPSARKKDEEMELEVLVWPAGPATAIPDDVLDSRYGRLLHLTAAFFAEV
ncbi:hypothetical protein ACHHYP_14672 [Achlya hypogyna]|uniref:Uncharacterized protein n=1 Tax=Achlya hypogyna TaxID=1202772 RepID=A0A1V9YCM9_ACHHY|nr:hypothetical protein ACHHYP_14672 [Achlya hypogyna]